MKKYAKIAYIVLILIILIFGFSMYKVSGKNNTNEDVKDKTLSEIEYLENKLVNLFNEVNNIKFENYTISATEINENKTQSKNEESTKSEDGNGSKNDSGDESKSSSNLNGSSDSSGKTSTNGESEEENNKQYKLETNGVLTSTTDINWTQIKNDVEKIYTLIYPMTIDLYQTKTNQEDIVNFNKEFDSLTKSAKDENKENYLLELAKLYDYLPKFIENCTNNQSKNVVIKTKNNIFKAYSILDKEDWNKISSNINAASQEFTKLITNVNQNKSVNHYNVNKAYVIINELQNAINLKDKEVFLIKYKNLLEELENI